MPRVEGGQRLRGITASATAGKPLVSVITVVFNGAKHVEETIRAVAEQTYPNIEHIVIDGGSTDGTLDILTHYDSHIGYWMSETDNGLYDAMNKGVALVSDAESYILFANADDTLDSPDAIERAIFASAGEDLLYGKMILADAQVSAVVGHPVELADLARQTICHPATFVRRKVFDTVGRFDTSYT